MSFKYRDILYGEIEITEPVILDLINCPTVQRLKGVDQAGYFEAFFPGTAHSRFDHSLGVYLLLKKYGASLEEQIAGLIHDVSHAVFSHAIDYVLDAGSEKEQNHQDNIFNNFIKASEIPGILKRHGFDADYLSDDRNFPLKERELPDLCADRIDYSLRDAIVYGEITDGQSILNNLTVENGQWLFKDFVSAQEYAKLFLTLNTKYYSGLVDAVGVRTVGDCLRYALTKNYITENDLYTTDKEVLTKIKSYLSADAQLQLLFKRMGNQVGFKNNPDDYDAKVFIKSRMVDPLCRHNGEIKKLSAIEPAWIEIIKRESEPKEYFLKFEE